MTSTPQKLASSLNSQLEAARTAYYAGSPIISDAEYDTLEAQLAGLVEKHPELASIATALTTVGSDASASGRVKHRKPMRSIENKYDLEDVQSWAEEVGADHYVIEPKFDGISLSLEFDDTKLANALTRGDGDAGEDITRQVAACMAIPSTVPASLKNLNIRGEAVMRNETLELINKENKLRNDKLYSSTRNLCAGTLKLKDLTEVARRDIMLMPWAVLGDGLDDSHVANMEKVCKATGMSYLGVRVPRSLVKQETEIMLQRIREEVRDTFGVECDGVVIKVDSLKQQRELGVGSKFANFQVCFKPQSASAVTYLREVLWSIGRTGKMTPVVVCDPVVLAGAQVTRATVNNITWIEQLGLKIGAQIEVLRSGDVIPVITRVLDDTGATPVKVPTACPECSTKLLEEKEPRSGVVTHFCPNVECPGRVRALLTFIADRSMLEIDGLGPEMANKLIEGGFARNLAELFEFANDANARLQTVSRDQFERDMAKNGLPGSATYKMVTSVEKTKNVEYDRWIAALGIPMVSKSMGKVIAKTLKLEGKDFVNMPSILLKLAQSGSSIENLGASKKAVLRQWASNPVNVDIVKRLAAAGVSPAPMFTAVAANNGGKQPLAGITFCITGEFSEDRDSLYKKLESLGAVGKSGVSSKTNVLVVGDGAGKSKLAKADQLGIRREGKAWLVKVLAENGIPMASDENVEEL